MQPEIQIYQLKFKTASANSKHFLAIIEKFNKLIDERRIVWVQ